MGRNHQTMSTPAIEKTTDDIVTVGTYRSSRVRGIRRKTIGNVGSNVGKPPGISREEEANKPEVSDPKGTPIPREHQTKGGKLESLSVLLAVTVTSMLWVPVNLCR